MIALYILLIIVGFVLLVKGADWLVDGASGIAKKLHVSPLVIGLTVVAFGTSAPELAVSITSALTHATDISVGNVLGSNIVNILLILGVTALIKEIPIHKESFKLDFPVLILSSVLILGLGLWGNALNWWDGVIMLAVLVAYEIVTLLGSKDEPTNELEVEEVPEGKLQAWYFTMQKKGWFLVVLALVGLGMVVGGGMLLVDSATALAREFNVSERIIGLTIVAIGTSLPELVTSVVAAKKGETDIAVGNIIGSNIANVLLVSGAASLFYPLAFDMGNLTDALVALGAAVLLLVLSLFKGNKLKKPAGIVMLLAFVAYYVSLFIVR